MLMLGGASSNSKRSAEGAPARQQQPLGWAAQRVGSQQQPVTVRAAAPVAAAAAAVAVATASSNTDAAPPAELISTSVPSQRTTRSRARHGSSLGASRATDAMDALDDGGPADQCVAQPVRAVKTRKLALGAVLPATSDPHACGVQAAAPLPSTGLLSVSPQQLPQAPRTPAVACGDGGRGAEDSRATPTLERRVRFAPGPVEGTPDGHPLTEGCIARPVRHNNCPAWGQELTRGNVLLLESLLGAECEASVLRLKRRVGLLPLIRPPRPHATSKAPSPTRAASVKTVKAALRAVKASKGANTSKGSQCAVDDVDTADQGALDQGLWISNSSVAV